MEYDVIVIGSGISGLCAAAKLTSVGKKVLVLEKQDSIGGYFSGFITEEGDIFDYAVSYVLACGENETVGKFIKVLGMEKRISFKKLDYTDNIYLPGRHIAFHGGKEEFKETLYEQFPDSKEEIDNLINWLDKFQKGVSAQGPEAMKFFMNYFQKDYEWFLNKYISNQELKAVLSMRIQADPASLMIMAGFLVECYFNGMYYPEHGSYNFVKLLGDYITENGGQIKCGTEIKEFETRDDKIISVISSGGDKFCSENYIYNGDVIKLFTNYLPDKSLISKELKAISGRKTGHSSLSIYLAVEGMDLSRFKGGRVYYSNTYDIFKTYRQIENGEIPDNYIIKLHFPTMHDDKLTNKSRNLIRIETDIFYNKCKDDEKKYIDFAEAIMNEIERELLKDLHKHIVYKRIITPIEFEKMFGHTNASGTGWAHTTENMMVSKFSQKTAYSNLFIAGQWGEFGSGLRQLILSGEKAVDYILRRKS